MQLTFFHCLAMENVDQPYLKILCLLGMKRQSVSLFSANLIGVLGLGHVGLSLAGVFEKTRKILVFDFSYAAVNELQIGVGKPLSVPSRETYSTCCQIFSKNIQTLLDCDGYTAKKPLL